MKTNLLTIALFGLLIQIPLFAQNRTTVNATNREISDNLDLRAVASIFGDSRDLADFERQLNEPRNKISNLDLNFDREVDYLRVIEVVENNTHLIILQAVLERDVFQDVATIEVERGRNNQVQIQVVGDVFMYGPNYIYEPVYVNRPIIYNHFWVNNYNPYYSPYHFNFYPSYYFAWTPFPVYRYRRDVHVHINQNNYYNYSNSRRSTNAVALYQTRRSNGYERKYPNQSFTNRNDAANRYELDNSRNSGRRVTNNSSRNYDASQKGNTRVNTSATGIRTAANANVGRGTKNNSSVRNYGLNTSTRVATPATSSPTRTTPTRTNTTPSSTTRKESGRNISQQQPQREVQQRSNRVEQARGVTRSAPQVRSSGSSVGRNAEASTRTRTNSRN